MAKAIYWRLTIEKQNGACVSVLASEEILRMELNEWIAYERGETKNEQEAEETKQEHFDAQGPLVRCIHGVSDDASRSDVIIAYRFLDVIGMALVEMR